MHDEPSIYLWSSTASIPSELSSSISIAPPEILSANQNLSKPTGSAPVKWDLKWLPTAADKKPGLVLGHQQGYVLMWPEGRDLILRFENEDGGDDSEDSLFEILTGRKGVPKLTDQRGEWVEGAEIERGVEEEEGESTVGLEDTFREKRRAKEVTGGSEFYESGMDEMF